MTHTLKDMLGRTYTDAITGFSGTCVAVSSHITGCDQAALQPRGLTDKGDIPTSHWFDTTRLAELEHMERVVVPTTVETKGADERVMRAPGLRR